MKNFTFVARDESGNRRQGVHTGSSAAEVLGWLGTQGLFPISVSEISNKDQKAQVNLSSARRIKSADMAAVCWQLDAMVEGGIPITAAISTIVEDIENHTLKYVLGQVLARMHKGESLSKSMAQFPGVFNNLSRAVVMAGETGGNLSESLKRLGDYYDNRDQLRKKVQSAMAYPAFVMFFVVLIVIFVMAFIVPRFRVIFDQIGTDLPAFTQGFMGFYDFTKDNIVYLVVSLGIVVTVCTVLARKTSTGSYLLSKTLLSLPLMGRIISQAFLAGFCKTMATLLAGGVSILEVLTILSDMTDNDIIKASILKTRENIMAGHSISASMSRAGFFPNMAVKMAQVGEQSGSLVRVFERTSKYYEHKVDAAIGTLTGLLEPIMIVTVGAIVLVVVLALYLPIFSMSQ